MNNKTIKELKNSMLELDLINAEIKQKKLEFEKENSDILTKKSDLQESIRICRQILTKEGLEMYNLREDKFNKNLIAGIKIRIKNITEIEYDKKEALEWAKKKDLFLKLDVKAFETFAETQDVDFVTITKKTTPSVTFPTKAEKLLID